ncbi:MAG: peptidase, partial [Bacteroidales bacterium]|nr:peptidase [Bacteroidales bacterium]
MKLRKLNRNIHRDLGYIFFGLTVIYAMSGIALNHLDDWNPNYIINTQEFAINQEYNLEKIDKQIAIDLTNDIAPREKFKNFY